MTGPFNILGQNQTSFDAKSVRAKYDELLTSNDFVVFMKGTADFPQCCFSANTVGILKNLGVEFKSFDILTDPTMRQAVKEFSGWPTYPQIYYKGQLLGGNDVITEMYANGELQDLINGN